MSSSILLDCVRISGFRAIKNLEVFLSRTTVLIGTNNSGKTSLIKALQLSLGDYSRYISDEDFFIGTDDKRVNEINVDVKFVPTNSSGERITNFDNAWTIEFGDKIRAGADNKQFLAFRTRIKPNEIKGGFECSRFVLQTWSGFNAWLDEKPNNKIDRKIHSIPFVSIEAQRDIHNELQSKSSFSGKILSDVEYQRDDIIEIEKLIDDLNSIATEKSEALKSFKAHLGQLTQSFKEAGNVEITPFPKKIRDLSKYFSVHFGDNDSGVFSMEYHGMGTRSWASILSAKAFIESTSDKHKKELEPFFPILAVEEPEAHLHPNAQKTLYQQLSDTHGQVIVSTHSPYFAAVADIKNIRSFRKSKAGITVMQVGEKYTSKDKETISSVVMSKLGEIIFAKALILCEGESDEQLIPAFFDVYSGKSFFSLGLCCVAVNGKRYSPFIKLACSLGIPTFIVSDNDGDTQDKVTRQIKKLRAEHQLLLNDDIFAISYLCYGNDLERELLSITSLREKIITALLLLYTYDTSNDKHREAKRNEISSLEDPALLKMMQDNKTSYSSLLADRIRKDRNEQDIPVAIKKAIDQIKIWLAI
jgi:putative ATP-dependent endonuclease of OLD family